MKGKIVIIGSSNTDMVIKAEHFPVPGETILGHSFLMSQGGKGANQAVAAARTGGDVTFITKVGCDIYGEQSIEKYKTEGINTDYIISDSKNHSGIAFINVNASGENTIIVVQGANGNLKPTDIDQAITEIEQAEIILMQLEIPLETVEYVAEIASRKKIKVVLNPAPAQIIPDRLFKKLFLIIPNETEAEALTGMLVTNIETAQKAADIISSKGVQNVIITLGEKGALIKDNAGFRLIPAVKTQAVDTTAAGDTFCGTLCVAITEGNSIAEAAKIANKYSSLSVTRMGAQSSIPYKKEIT